LGLGLQGLVRLSEGEHRGGGAQRASILADALEAVVGAVTLDAGLEAAQAVAERLFGPGIASSEIGQYRKDAKTELQEWLQARRLAVPAYRIVATTGQAHEQTFEVACEVPALGLACAGQGRSRRAAEQEAARAALQRLREPVA
ncbi:MAG: ribonuclease III family protein, partial [Rubrivivax sp.]